MTRPLPLLRAAGLPALLLAALALGCAGTRVDTTAQPDVDWSSYRTFVQDLEDTGPLAERVRAEIARELEAKGLVHAHGEADLWVRFELRSQRETRRRNVGDPDVDLYVTETYIAKRLVVEVTDMRRSEVVWTGVGRSELPESADLEEKAVEAVRAILAEFPRTATRPTSAS